jgi:hypothetical protein
MGDIGAILLIALGGLLAGGAVSRWKAGRLLSAALWVCGLVAVAAGVLRLGYFG